MDTVGLKATLAAMSTPSAVAMVSTYVVAGAVDDALRCIVAQDEQLAALRAENEKLRAMVERMLPYLPEECRMGEGWRRGAGHVSEEEARDALKGGPA